MHKQLWIGLAEVRPLAECTLLDGARGAYVHVMAWANDADQFRAAVVKRATELALVLIDLRETEPWAIRSSGDSALRNEFYEMADRLESDVKQVAFGRFHAWLQDQPVEAKTSADSTAHSQKKDRAPETPHRAPNPGVENGQ